MLKIMIIISIALSYLFNCYFTYIVVVFICIYAAADPLRVGGTVRACH